MRLWGGLVALLLLLLCGGGGIGVHGWGSQPQPLGSPVVPEGLEDSALFLDEVAQVLVAGAPKARTTNWGCAFDVKRPWNMHQDMLEYEALVSQVNWQHPSSNTKLAKHSLNMLSTELEHMFLQLTCIRCVEDDSTPAVVAQLAQVVQERERRLAFLIGEIQQTGEFRPELLQLLQHTHEKMIPAIRSNDFATLGRELGLALQRL